MELVRNYHLTRNILENQDRIIKTYKLKSKEFVLIWNLRMKINSFKPYIEFSLNEMSSLMCKKCFYRTLDKLEERNIISIVNRSVNGKNPYQVYFTTDFIENISDEEFSEIYNNWLDELLHPKKEVEKS